MRIGVVGLGFMGSTHLKALQKIPEVQIAAVCGRDERALEGDFSHIEGNFGGPGERFDFSQTHKHRDLDEFLRDPDVDAIDICLPTDAHSSVAIKALEAGKHVFVEKPLALDGAAADAVLQESERAGKVVMCGQVLRFFPAYAGLAQELKTAGRVHSAIFRRRCAAPFWSKWLGDRNRSGGGVFDLLIHDVDICVRLFGVPEALSATGSEDMPNGIDVVTANLYYRDVPSVVVTGGWHHPKAYPFSMEYTVSADEATFDFNSARGDIGTVYTKKGESRPLDQPKCDAFEAELRYFVECCKANVKPSVCPPEESAAAVKIAVLMRDARARNGEKIECKI
jgi:predicted dehydrogenase